MGSKERGKIRRLYREHGLPKIFEGKSCGSCFWYLNACEICLKKDTHMASSDVCKYWISKHYHNKKLLSSIIFSGRGPKYEEYAWVIDVEGPDKNTWYVLGESYLTILLVQMVGDVNVYERVYVGKGSRREKVVRIIKRVPYCQLPPEVKCRIYKILRSSRSIPSILVISSKYLQKKILQVFNMADKMPRLDTLLCCVSPQKALEILDELRKGQFKDTYEILIRTGVNPYNAVVLRLLAEFESSCR
ncbi:DUF655 domain-containing protein [Thermococcus sp.]|uniref:DUF655 domain-containing protein n=1 Tax=Thermococcus sp. TaxID=35749 RepID=UPI0025CD662F|nr:DUF655 domain-containing protein [Thermococcus sp.]